MNNTTIIVDTSLLQAVIEKEKPKIMKRHVENDTRKSIDTTVAKLAENEANNAKSFLEEVLFYEL